jgi:hypothetical protein
MKRDEERKRMRGGRRGALRQNRYKGRVTVLLVPYRVLRVLMVAPFCPTWCPTIHLEC